jgi:hypothetical protein
MIKRRPLVGKKWAFEIVNPEAIQNAARVRLPLMAGDGESLN